MSNAGQDWKAFSCNKTLHLHSQSRPSSDVPFFSYFWFSEAVVTFETPSHKFVMDMECEVSQILFLQAMSNNGTSCTIISMLRPKVKWPHWNY
jgi:hypothetical protein